MLCCLTLCIPAAAADGETMYNSAYCFNENDFDADVLANLTGIFVTAVPDREVASICLGDRVICVGDVLTVDSLRELTLVPACAENCSAVMSYQPIRDTMLAPVEQVSVRIKSGKNEVPKAIDTEFETYKNIANDGKLAGSDPEESPLTFQLVESPKRGSVTLEEDGSYVYTPKKNKVGEDAFTFTVTDDAGNVSAPASVKIKIIKPSDSKTFSDLASNNDQFEAMWMQNSALSGGRAIAGQFCFSPQESVSRSEFLVMAMTLADMPVDTELTVSGFADACDAPAWVQPYLSAAMRYGISRGTITDAGLMFYPNDAITGQEAAVFLQNILELPTAAASMTETDAPAWAAGALQACAQAGIVFEDAEEAMTRMDAAKLLYQTSKLLK
jgi:hypothetical protein